MSAASRSYEARLAEAVRPRTRGDCADGPRPCPWFSCRYHLAELHGAGAGELSSSWPVDEEDPVPGLYAMPDTCALDVAGDGEHTLEDVADALNVTRERTRQVESEALRGVVRQRSDGQWYALLPGVLARGTRRLVGIRPTELEAEELLEDAISRRRRLLEVLR